MKKMMFGIIVMLITSMVLSAQNSGNHIFDNAVLHEVRFEFTESDYLTILTTNFDNADQGNVPYLMAKVTIDEEEVDSVGVRYKGFTSYTSGGDKNPLKIDFNEFVSGKKYDGLKKLNLTNGTGDPSMQRDPICYNLMRHSGVKASRTSFAKVYFNGEYRGVYTIIEQVDKTFLKDNFSDPEGNLFKNKGWSDLEWLGSDGNSYKETFALKTNKTEDDWSGFVNFMNILNNSSADSFPAAIQSIFDIDLFLKALAVDVATDNWDSYLQHGRNWYMYEDSVAGVFHWIPWDYNLALGGTLGFTDEEGCFAYADFYSLTDGTTTVGFSNGSFYSGNPTWLWDFGDGTTSTEENPTHVYASAGTYNVCLTLTESDTCYNQNCKTIDTNYNPADCAVIVDGSCPHPANTTFQIVVEFFPGCCSEWSEECEQIYSDFSAFSDSGFTIDQSDNNRTLIKRLMEVPAYENTYYNHMCELLNYTYTEERVFDLLDHNRELIREAVETEPHALYPYDEFLTDIGGMGDTIGLKKIIIEKLTSLRVELDTVFACPTVDFVAFHDLVINEFVASNDSTSAIADPAGEFEDWIELYNNTGSTMDLSDIYLSDDKNALKKWRFPSGTTIPADGYLIVWADKDEDQEGLHTNFKLSKSGEQLVLTNSDDSVIDSLTFGEQTTNVASARRPNGTGDFVFQAATFSANNEVEVGIANLESELSINVHPVPAKDFVMIGVNTSEFLGFTAKVFSSTGQLILQQNANGNAIRLDLSNWNPGMYFIYIANEKGEVGREKLIVY